MKIEAEFYSKKNAKDWLKFQSEEYQSNHAIVKINKYSPITHKRINCYAIIFKDIGRQI